MRESTHSEQTILFADICGSTRLYETLGDAQARKVVSTCFEDLQSATNQHGGRVVKTIGDEILCIFPSTENAVQAAIEFQELLSVSEYGMDEEGFDLSIKVGMQHGAALEEDGDVFGDAVNVAARMVSFAKGGQIITTRETISTLPPHLQDSTRHLDTTMVKGKQQEIEIHEVIWEEGETTSMWSGLFNVDAVRTRLVIRYGEQVHVLEQNCEPFVMGRYRRADLTVDEQLVSREHARIEWRRGKFVLVDSSTNGTYALIQDQIVWLRREDVSLSGEGTIGLGRRPDEDDKAIVHYKCETVIDSKTAGQFQGSSA
jgi:class 3 adenylate cyclase